jgi:hypothetical protein
MSIAIDAVLHRAHGGGVEKAIEGMVGGVVDAGLAFHAEVFLPDSMLKGLALPSAASRVRLHRVSHASRPERILKEQWLVLSRRGVRLWHFLGYVAPFFLPRAAVVVSVYDIIALTYPELCMRLNRTIYAATLPRTIGPEIGDGNLPTRATFPHATDAASPGAVPSFLFTHAASALAFSPAAARCPAHLGSVVRLGSCLTRWHSSILRSAWARPWERMPRGARSPAVAWPDWRRTTAETRICDEFA